jgi:hypothetical protein
MRQNPDAERTPSWLETTEPQELRMPLDVSPLAGFELASVTVEHRQIHGFVTSAAGRSPLETLVGQRCDDPFCPYRSIELRLHPSVGALMSNFQLACEAQGLPRGAFIGQFDRDIVTVDSAFPVATADLSNHPILHKVRVSLDRLHDCDAATPEWELVRTIRDGLGTNVIELPLAKPYSGRELLVQREFAQKLKFTRQGSMDELTPILNTDAREELALSWRLAAMLRPGRGG